MTFNSVKARTRESYMSGVGSESRWWIVARMELACFRCYLTVLFDCSLDVSQRNVARLELFSK